MPGELPSQPSLEHLKKQAKILLRDLHQKKAEAIEKFSSVRLKSGPRLSDAQFLIASEYGFPSWQKLKEHVESLAAATTHPIEAAKKAFHEDDSATLRRILKRHPRLKAMINEPVDSFDAPAITHARSRAMLDVLLAAGADINAKSRWWAGGFGLLDCAEPDLASYAIERGAVVSVHAAARLGMLEKLKELVTANPKLVHERGGDGQTPLHFASTIEIAEYLLDRGADIDARDVDHESTPAQYLLDSHPEIVRYLIQRNCKTDILMAAALGDADLTLKHLDADPECIRIRVSDEYFPMVGGKNGGTIYQWKLGWYVSACQVAKKFGHLKLLRLLMERCPADEKLLNACWVEDGAMVKSLLASQPKLATTLSISGRRHLADAARNDHLAAVRLMLEAGLPVESFSHQHHATPLHWAAWHGNAEMVRLVLRNRPPIENADNEFNGTPIGWAIHGSENGWFRQKGDYAATVEALLDAGAKPPAKVAGNDAVRDALARRGLH